MISSRSRVYFKLFNRFVLLFGVIVLIIFTLNPPRGYLDGKDTYFREESAPLYSAMFHYSERPLAKNGFRESVDKNGKIFHTNSRYGLVFVDWTRYCLGFIFIILLVVLILLISECILKVCECDWSRSINLDT